MTDDEQKALADMAQSSGYALLKAHIASEIEDGWESFINLPVEKKTSKQAFFAQSQYRVLKDLVGWVDKRAQI